MIVRKIGLGDQQHVRISLLGVLYLGKYDETSLREVMRFARSKSMMARIHINGDRPERHLIECLQRDNSSHQFEVWSCLQHDEFIKKALYPSDFIVMPDENMFAQLEREWEQHDGRFTKGNFSNMSLQEIEQAHPELVLRDSDIDKLWNAWNNT